MRAGSPFHGIKFSDFFLADLTTCLEFERATRRLFGSDEMILGALATGAKALVGSTYGFAAPLFAQIIKTYGEGKLKDAQSWMTKAVRLIRLIDKEPGPYHSCVKQVVWPLLGFEVGPCRVPQAVLSEEEVAHARARLEESGFAQELARESFSFLEEAGEAPANGFLHSPLLSSSLDRTLLCYWDLIMTFKTFFVFLCGLAGFGSLFAKKPNALLIMSDDMGYSDLGCFGGNPHTPTRFPRPRRHPLHQLLQREHVLGLAGLHADRGLSPDLLEERCPAPPLPDPARGSADKRVRNRNDGEVALGGEIHQKQRGQRRLPRPARIRPLLRNPRRSQQFLRPFGLRRDRKLIDEEFMKDPDYYFTDAIGKEAIAFLKETPKDKPFFSTSPSPPPIGPSMPPPAKSRNTREVLRRLG